MSAPAAKQDEAMILLREVRNEIRNLRTSLDVREDLSGLVRQTLSCVEGLRSEVQAVSKRFDLLEREQRADSKRIEQLEQDVRSLKNRAGI